MSFELAQFSIVIVGKGHNPTILNPDFLAIRGIVPRAWGWEPAEVLTTPPLSLVRYPIGVSIQMDPQRLQISDLQPGEPPVESKIIPIARAIVETLPNVRYTAVGINFQAIARVESPDRFLKARFLKPGPWDTAEHPVQMAGFRLVYPAPGGGPSSSPWTSAASPEATDPSGASSRTRTSTATVSATPVRCRSNRTWIGSRQTGRR